ncbi:MAG: ABC transporter substrate-binding protein [Thermomicrobiales bacterium]
MNRRPSFASTSTTPFTRRGLITSGAGLVAGAALAGSGTLAGAQATPGASPASSPVASPVAAVSKVAERASGDVRVTGFWGEAELEQLEKVWAAFSEKYPNIKVNAEPISSDYLIKIQADIAAGNVADVFMVQNEYAQDFMSRSVLLSIDDYMTEDGIAKDEFYTPLVDAYTWQDKLYGLPKDWSPIAMVYDPDAFDAAGASVPTTWEELRDTLTKLKDNKGTVQFALDPQMARYVIWLFQAGGSLTNPEVTEIELNSDAAKTALNEMYGLYKDGLSTPSADIGAQWPGDAYGQGLTSVAFEGNWLFPSLASDHPDRKYAIAELPAGPAGKGTPAFTTSYSIFSGSKNPDAAWVVVNFLTGPEGARIASELGLAIPGRPDLEAGWLQLFPERKPYVVAGTYAISVQYGPGGQKFQQDADAILQSLWAGQIEPDAALQQVYDTAVSDITLTGQ